ncbi:MAG: type III-B CRISPR module RAMP protein Cmr4 [Deltaproteobacteria bacterium]|nr:type III-B CRISPR module RAMP protein Cmr4 [Deltaproteobacteria bacterium]
MAIFERHRYLLMTLDPVHIGTGGYRLGRVDNSIVREPGTRVPKIPGTALHGAARSYASRLYEDLAAAGKDHENVTYPATNPVCYTFGYTKGGETEAGEEKTETYSGVINVFDAQLLLFPVHSMYGPVWVSTRQRLKGVGFTVDESPNNAESSQDIGACFLSWSRTDPLNLGWLMLTVGGQVTVTAPDAWQGECWDTVKERLILVSEALFSQVVNSNLEVRTSVSIDPWRGAAAEGALFTYEALPRSTFLTLEIVVDDYRQTFPSPALLRHWSTLTEEDKKTLKSWDNDGVAEASRKFEALGLAWEGPAHVFRAGLEMLAWLGVGGMGTRGFGRLALVGDSIISPS